MLRPGRTRVRTAPGSACMRSCGKPAAICCGSWECHRWPCEFHSQPSNYKPSITNYLLQTGIPSEARDLGSCLDRRNRCWTMKPGSLASLGMTTTVGDLSQLGTAFYQPFLSRNDVMCA